MDIVFEKGSRERPRGHAIVYFKSASDQDGVWASYTVILPIRVDVSKYVPPFLMNQVGDLGPKELSAFAFPPAPERLDSYELLEQLAAARDDDVLFGGTINPNDGSAAMMSLNEMVQGYAEIYANIAPDVEAAGYDSEHQEDGIDVNEVLYGLMSNSDKLAELTKLVSRLRFALEGSDIGQMSEAEADITLLASHLPENNNIQMLIEAVKSKRQNGYELAELYLQRCFHLVQEEYTKLGQLEAKIKELEAGQTTEQE